jgi:hypothetical protein
MKMKRVITRRSYKFIGNEPIHGLLYTEPLILEILHPNDDTPIDASLPTPTVQPLLTIPSQFSQIDLPEILNDTPPILANHS